MSSKTPKPQTQVITRDVRVNLLPPEIAKAEKAGAQRRLMIFLAVISIIVVGLATAAAAFAAATAQASLATEETRAQMLLTERAKYTEAQYTAGLIQSTEDAQRGGAAADVDWAAFIRDVIGVTPPTIAITGFDGESTTVTIPSVMPSGPLEGPRLGQLRLDSETADYALVDQWVRGLETLDGYVGSTVQRIENTESDQGYRLAVTMYFDNDRLRERFPLEGAETEEAQTDDAEGDEG